MSIERYLNEQLNLFFVIWKLLISKALFAYGFTRHESVQWVHRIELKPVCENSKILEGLSKINWWKITWSRLKKIKTEYRTNFAEQRVFRPPCKLEVKEEKMYMILLAL